MERGSPQCGNLRIFLPLIFGILEVQNLLFLPFLGLWILLIWYFSAFWKYKNSQKLKFRASKCVKKADFALLQCPKLISRKIWMIEKSWNFHTVAYIPLCTTKNLAHSTIFYKKPDLCQTLTYVHDVISNIYAWLLLPNWYGSQKAKNSSNTDFLIFFFRVVWHYL